jgi:hypothetical protein
MSWPQILWGHDRLLRQYSIAERCHKALAALVLLRASLARMKSALPPKSFIIACQDTRRLFRLSKGDIFKLTTTVILKVTLSPSQKAPLRVGVGFVGS